MNFRDRAIIICKFPLKEKTSVVTVFTEKHGLYSGVVRSVATKQGSGILEGDLVDFAWNARLHEHLGSAKIDTIKSHNAKIIGSKLKLYSFNSIVSLIRGAFHEREPHNNLFPFFLEFVENLAADLDFTSYIRLELAILQEAGFGLQLTECAATGSHQELLYVSPKSGRAVSKEAGNPYADKLLTLPQFLLTGEGPNEVEMEQAAELTDYFFKRYIFQGTGTPDARSLFIQNITKSCVKSPICAANHIAFRKFI